MLTVFGMIRAILSVDWLPNSRKQSNYTMITTSCNVHKSLSNGNRSSQSCFSFLIGHAFKRSIWSMVHGDPPLTFNIYTVHICVKYILLKKTYVNLESALKTHL